MQKNLICYLYPRKNMQWCHTVDIIAEHANQFDGATVFSVSTDECCLPANEVVEYVKISLPRSQFLLFDNDPGLGEVKAFLPVLESIIDLPGITMYCHSKGSTHDSDEAASHHWRRAMAIACLKYPRLIDCVFESGKNICGSFRADGPWVVPDYHNWHFAGTWFWFRNNRARELNWRNVHQNFMGVEAWPGIFPPNEAQVLFCSSAHAGYLYNVQHWKDNFIPSLKWWQRSIEKVLNDYAA